MESSDKSSIQQADNLPLVGGVKAAGFTLVPLKCLLSKRKRVKEK
jgi:hypothetical protein